VVFSKIVLSLWHLAVLCTQLEAYSVHLDTRVSDLLSKRVLVSMRVVSEPTERTGFDLDSLTLFVPHKPKFLELGGRNSFQSHGVFPGREKGG
jgi:hypothetical protein